MPAKDANYNGSDTAHLSDCAVYNEPAFPAGPCNCRRVMHQRLTEAKDTIGKFVGFINFYGMNDKAREWGLPDD